MSGWHRAVSFLPLQAMVYSPENLALLYRANSGLIQEGMSAVQQFFAAAKRSYVRLMKMFSTVIERRKASKKQCKTSIF
jgi:hypothetical protein